MNRLQEISDDYAQTLLPVVAIIVILMVIGLFGNPLVIYFYGYRKKATASYMFIVTLAVFDLTSCLFSMPIEILDIFYFYTFPDPHACRALRFINYFSSIASGTTLIAIAVDRFRKICRPFESQISLKFAKIVILCVVLFSLFSSWPSLVIYDVVSVNISDEAGVVGHDCRMLISDTYTNYIFAYQIYLFLLFVITLVVLIVIYILVGKKLIHLRSFAFYSARRRKSSVQPISVLTAVSEAKRSVTNDDEPSLIDLCSVGDNCNDGRLSVIDEKDTPTNSRPTSACSTDILVEAITKDVLSGYEESKVGKEKSMRQTQSFTEDCTREDIYKTSRRPQSSGPPSVLQNVRKTDERITARRSSAVSCVSESGIVTEIDTGCSSANETSSNDIRKLQSQNINTRRYTTIAISISIAFVFSYLPYLILSLWTAVFVVYDPHQYTSSGLVAIELFLRSFLFNSVCNPLIYGLLNSEFKKMVFNIFKTIFCCGRGVRALKEDSSQ